MNEEERTRRLAKAFARLDAANEKKAGLRARINKHLDDMRLSDLEAVLRMIEQWKAGK